MKLSRVNNPFEKLRDHFLAALEHDGLEAQLRYVTQCGPDDPQLRDQLIGMLKAHHEKDGFLASQPAQTIESQTDREVPGTMIGPYKLLEQIGEGGMGVVYVAEQKEPVRRTVALKVIKPGMDTRQVVARIEAERQAVAMMNHPNVAKVLDAGATDLGRPYFVMELVKGVPITEFCDQQKLDTRQRLQLFISVCQAVQHAHQKGLIHRDLKPSNVLVEMHDVIPVPKVIDFGVAKAIGQQLTEKTLHTGFSQLIGTPLYMSPEQAGQSSIDVDTRSDVYSLGVLLYEMLTGRTPFEIETLRNAGFDEMRRIIREVDPPRPSARVSTLEANALSTISDYRKVDPQKLSQQLRGELDWIVMKALEKDRNRRYESASGLARDLQRYLADEPVEARPASTGYRLRKFLRRNKGPAVAASVVLTVLLAGILGTTLGLVCAIKAEGVAKQRLEETEAERAKAAASAVAEAESREKADDERGRAEANLQLAFLAMDRVYLDLIGRRRLLREQAGELSMFGDGELVDLSLHVARISGFSPQEQELIQSGLAFYDQIAQRNPTSTEGRFESGKAFLRIALLNGWLKNPAAAQQGFEKAIKQLKGLTAASPDHFDYFLELGRAYSQAAESNRLSPQSAGNFDSAIMALGRAIELDPRCAEAFVLRGDAYQARSKKDAAIADYEMAVKLTPDDANSHVKLALLLFDRHSDRALMHFQEAVRLEPSNGRFREKLSYAYQQLRDIKSAAAVYTEGIQFVADPKLQCIFKSMASELVGNHRQTVESVDQFIQLGGRKCNMYLRRAAAYRNLGEADRAIADLTSAAKTALSSGDHETLADEYQRLGRVDESIAYYKKAIEIKPNFDRPYFRLCNVLLEQRRYHEALAAIDKALTLAPQFYYFKRRAAAYFHLGQYERALDDLEKAIPKDFSTVGFISADHVADCPSADFRNGMKQLANQTVEIHRGSPRSIEVRARLLLRLGDWEQASKDVAKLLSAEEAGQHSLNVTFKHSAALAALHAKDHDLYRKISARMTEQYTGTDDPTVAHVAAWTVSLAPDAIDDYGPAAALARRAVAMQESDGRMLTTLGAVLLRSGQYDAARQQLIAATEASVREPWSKAYDAYLLAITEDHLGHTADARAWLNKANKQADSELNKSPPWNHRLTLELLRQETTQHYLQELRK